MARRSRPAPRRAAPAPTRQTAPVPQHAPTAVAPASGVQPMGMMANVASTAAGVAIGHTVGNVVSRSIFGGSEHAAVEAAPAAAPAYQQPTPGQNPCQLQMEQFLNCSQRENDLSLCDGFNQLLKECRMNYSQHM